MAFLWSLAILEISGKYPQEWLQRFSFQVSLSAKPSPCSKVLSPKPDKEWIWKVVMTHASHGWGEWPSVLSSRSIMWRSWHSHNTMKRSLSRRTDMKQHYELTYKWHYYSRKMKKFEKKVLVSTNKNSFFYFAITPFCLNRFW